MRIVVLLIDAAETVTYHVGYRLTNVSERLMRLRNGIVNRRLTG